MPRFSLNLLWLISSARGTAAAVLVLGIVGGCGMSAAAEQYQGKRRGSPRIAVIYRRIIGADSRRWAIGALLRGSG